MINYGASIQLTDRMTGSINNILNKLNSMNMTCSTVQNTIENSFKMPENVTTGYDSINEKISETENDINKNRSAQNNFNQSISNGVSQASSLKNTISKVVSALGLYKIGSELIQTGKQAIEYASDLNEVQDVVDVTFGSSASAINDWSTQTLEAYGLNQLSAKKYSGTMGAMLKSSGIAQDAVGNMSMTITELAGDMASFYNLSGDEAFQKIRSGISGETEPLKQLGVNMSVANLEAYAMSQGINTAYQKMTQAEQTMLRYNYLLSVTSDAQGDFARTSDSYANQTKLLSENWKAFTGDIAASAIPRLTSLAQLLNNMFQSADFQIFAQKMKIGINMAVSVIEKLLTGISKVGSFCVNNWSVISPIILGIVGAMGLWKTITGIIGIVTAVQSQITAIQKYNEATAVLANTAAYDAETIAKAKATVAQTSLNTAMFACPITWIILAVVALIAIIIAVINYVRKTQDITTSTLGIIMGALAVAGAFIYNLIVGVINSIVQVLYTIFVEPFICIIEWVLNAANGGFTSFGGAVANLIGQIISWFLGLGKVVTTVIDAIFGTDWTSGLTSLQDTVTSWGKSDTSISLSREAPTVLNRISYSSAWNTGTAKGDEWSQKIDDFKNSFLPDTSSFDKTALNTENTATSAGEIADNVSSSSVEQLKWLRMIAEREAVNKFTTADIHLTVNSDAVVNNTTDYDGFVSHLTEAVSDELILTANGLHT